MPRFCRGIFLLNKANENLCLLPGFAALGEVAIQ